MSSWRQVDTSLGLAAQVWGWIDSAQVPYWDALILAAAQPAGADYLLSEDFPANRRYGGIRVVNPFLNSPSSFSDEA